MGLRGYCRYDATTWFGLSRHDVLGVAATVPLGASEWTITRPTLGQMLSYRGVSRRVTR
jgi:hypothetical protein